MHSSMKLRPWEIDQMTLAEISLALDDDLEKRRLPTGYSACPDHKAYGEWWRSLTPMERLQVYREG